MARRVIQIQQPQCSARDLVFVIGEGQEARYIICSLSLCCSRENQIDLGGIRELDVK